MSFWSRVFAVLSLVPTLAHELTHYIFASLGSEEVHLDVELCDPESQVCVWRPIESRSLRAFAFLAPTICGSVVLGLWIAVGDSVEGFDLLGIVALGVYTVPSAADIRGAFGKQESQNNECKQ